MLTRTEKEWAFRTETILRRFEEPDDVRTFQKGKFEIVRIGGITVAMDDGTIHELRAAMLFYIPLGPPGHDSWVVGDAPYVSLHSLGTEHYTNK